GYFDKLRRADVFVFLDNVQMQKKGGTWTNRVKILMAGEARWVTAPIDRAFRGVRRISDIRFDESSDWRDKLMRTLSASYGRAPAYRETIALVEPLLASTECSIARYNVQAVTAIAQALGLRTDRLILGSNLGSGGEGTDRLIAITREVGGDAYLCGGGAQGYQDDAAFGRAGLQLIYQDLKHPVYAQAGAAQFVPGLSIV